MVEGTTRSRTWRVASSRVAIENMEMRSHGGAFAAMLPKARSESKATSETFFGCSKSTGDESEPAPQLRSQPQNLVADGRRVRCDGAPNIRRCAAGNIFSASTASVTNGSIGGFR